MHQLVLAEKTKTKQKQTKNEILAKLKGISDT